MENQLTASVDFCFKGEYFHFSISVDVDAWVFKKHGDMEALYDMIAAQHGLDRYRHEYDVMVMEPVHFTAATGLAAEYLCDDEFYIEGFQSARQEQKYFNTVQKIAQKHMAIENLAEHPQLKAALLEAYRCKA